ncbi:Signal transduction histidine kinase CheA [Paramagnetospirillum magnetotacticum MS-1]|uniref:Chemotaxis protein CheA n=1 Tax=Paramagnetospirillum magnetotacticum MS-1 TaxID=272627 RepID=A0A0C2UFR3_PARME|nr:AAA family ATPase [Paramagnetospirillum magnetotacticum]KIM00363.1 Signal transduction histidine kinase CheA [Paramagnetospirillum magnetotacticum MS-1]
MSLARGTAPGNRAILLRSTLSARPSQAVIDRLRREFALRTEIDAAWGAVPLSLDETSGRPSLTLSDPGGQLLSQLIASRSGPLRQADLSRLLRLSSAMARTLGHIHARGLIHKDVTPNNILIDETADTVVFTGFGSASQLQREHRHSQMIEIAVGNFAYMAPEQTGRMNRSVDSRSDLYSLGVVLYEVFTGLRPFSAVDPMEWVHCHIARQPSPPRERVAGLPDQVSAIIMKLLAKTAEERYQTAEGLATDLEHCLAQQVAEGRISSFPLAANDHSGILTIPEHLYGRESESALLLDAFRRVADDGAPELVLVSGYSGVGKSALVNQIHSAMVERDGMFGAGKFDQHKRDIPYSTFAQAFHTLVRQILGSPESDIRRWREAFLDAMGPNGDLLMDLIPQLELVIGKQPAVPELPPGEAHVRFLTVFRRFVSVLSRPEQPLVLFLDDLQWMDNGSMKLLEHLMTHPEVRYLLLIGSYRDNEVDSSHPLMLSMDTIRKGGRAVNDIVLKPLSADDLSLMVTDTLRGTPEQVEPLARLIHQKTAGNPFFAIQFLTSLAEEKLLWFDLAQGLWCWDLERIGAMGFSDNVVVLMAAKLRRLPEADQAELRRIACLGSGTTLGTLVMVYDRSEEECLNSLEKAIQSGFLIRSGDRLAFTHDRIQEAAYLSLPISEMVATHLQIGRRMLERLSETEVEDRLFDVIHHLNLGRQMITERAERDLLARLNTQAGRKAKASSANASARVYFALARNLLNADCWETDHDQTFALFLDLSECEYLVGNHAQADELFELLLGKTDSDDQSAQVWRLRFRMFMVSGRYGDAVAIAVKALERFGLTCPETEDDTAKAVQAARLELAGLLEGRHIADLVSLPECRVPAVRALIGVIADAIPAVYHVRPLLYPFLGLAAINLSLHHGVTEDSSAAFSGYSVSLVGRFEDFRTGLEFSELALKLGERFNSAPLKGTLLFRHGYFVTPWSKPIATIMPVLEETFRTCLDTGNLIYAAYVAYASAWMLFEKGEPLDLVLAHMRKFAPFAANARIPFAILMLRLQELFITGLQGVELEITPGVAGADGAKASYEALVGTAHGYGIAFYHVVRQVTPYLMGRHEEALAAARETAALVPKISSSVIESSHHFYGALAITALYPSADAKHRAEMGPWLAEHHRKLVLWAEHCPETFAARAVLIDAEIAALSGSGNEVMRLYETAILTAREQGQLHCEAIANERAGRFCLDQGLPSIAENYLRNARYCYTRWGALAKVAQLDQAFPRLADSAMADGAVTGFSGSADGLDLMTVIKAQQAVSGEIVLGNLVESLLRIVVEHAGADRGLLILRHGETFRIEAEAMVEGDLIAVSTCATVPSSDDLPLTVFQYVTRTRERVVIDNAIGPNTFMTEGYAARGGVKSVMCLPVVTHGALSAVLYLENHLAAGAFTRKRVAVLDLLASQASISLENAQLYTEMEERVRDRTRELAQSLSTVKSKSDQVSALLDNSGQGFLSFRGDLLVEPEFSHACLDFFDGSPAGKSVDELLFSGDEHARDTLRACIEEALKEPDPSRAELYLSLLPEEINIGDRILKTEFKPLDQAIMVVLTDVTGEKALAAQVARERTRLEMIVSAVTYGNDFFDAVAEFSNFVQDGPGMWRGRDRGVLYRTIHTFKGTFNQLGFHHLPTNLHEVESALQRLGRRGDAAEAASMVFARDWQSVLNADLETVREALGEDFMARRGVVTVTPEQAKRFERFARGLLAETEIPEVIEEIAAIRTVSLRQAIADFDKMIHQISARLEKEVGPLVVEGDDVRIDPEVFGPFLRSLGHVFRNAIDHGIEDPDSRLSTGKSEIGTIRCAIRRMEGLLAIDIADDGAGIDVENLRRRAAELTTSDVSGWDIADLVFADGISIRTEATELSGRGVGMTAVKASVEELGGSIRIDSRRGQGTHVLFHIPYPPQVEGHIQ